MKMSEMIENFLIMMEADVPTHVESPPGMGKTSAITKTIVPAIQKYIPAFKLIDVRLYNYDGPELHGLQFPDNKKKKTVLYPPDIWPSESELGLILFDELTAADRMLQVSAYQVMHEKRIGHATRFPNFRRAACSNLATDRAIVNPMPTPLANRMAHFRLSNDTNDFVFSAINNFEFNYPEMDSDIQKLCNELINPKPKPDHIIHPDIVGYLKFKTDHLNTFNPQSGDKAFATPRSWENVSKVLYCNPRTRQLTPCITSLIGEAVATSFVGFLKVKNEIDTADEIIANPKHARVPTSPAALFAVCNMLAYYAKHENFDQIMIYINKLSNQFQTMFVKDVISRDNTMVHHASFTKWAIDHADSLI